MHRLAAAALLATLCLALTAGTLETAPATLALGFVGDSITAQARYGAAPPARVAALLATPGRRVVAVNQGHSGATTADWLPGAPSGYLDAALAAFDRQGVRVVSVALGTNDSKRSEAVPPETYRANLAALCAALLARGYTVVLQSPPYAVAGAAGEFDAATDARLRAYADGRAGLADGRAILLGDTTAYAAFAADPCELVDGVHPGRGGVRRLAALWAAGLAPALDHPATP